MTELINTEQIAELTGLSAKTIKCYRNDMDEFPEPVSEIREGRRGPRQKLYRKTDILQWHQLHKQHRYKRRYYKRTEASQTRAGIVINNRAGIDNNLAVEFMRGSFSRDAAGIFIRRKRAAMNTPKTTTIHLSGE